MDQNSFTNYIYFIPASSDRYWPQQGASLQRRRLSWRGARGYGGSDRSGGTDVNNVTVSGVAEGGGYGDGSCCGGVRWCIASGGGGGVAMGVSSVVASPWWMLTCIGGGCVSGCSSGGCNGGQH
ncbi:glycine-rich cell wall structural protein 2-like [Helianthus annuus]|uniref:glycine-rich cell wall structural protein 2-like n=1 Tax=Helianthus annuus TaxID=4232 RepID=UPI000B905C52|nr:glycine-rich cell wall structural protein 2-like [Helianthus annuus]